MQPRPKSIAIRKRILELFEEHKRRNNGRPPYIEDLIPILGLGKTTVYHHLREMVADGDLVRGEHGRCGTFDLPRGAWLDQREWEYYRRLTREIREAEQIV